MRACGIDTAPCGSVRLRSETIAESELTGFKAMRAPWSSTAEARERRCRGGREPAAAPTLSGLGRGTPGGSHRFKPGELTFRDRLTPQPNGTAWGGVDAARAHGPGENLLRSDNPPAR